MWYFVSKKIHNLWLINSDSQYFFSDIGPISSTTYSQPLIRFSLYAKMKVWSMGARRRWLWSTNSATNSKSCGNCCNSKCPETLTNPSTRNAASPLNSEKRPQQDQPQEKLTKNSNLSKSFCKLCTFYGRHFEAELQIIRSFLYSPLKFPLRLIYRENILSYIWTIFFDQNRKSFPISYRLYGSCITEI